MQVFVTDTSPIKSAAVLDNARCNKQILECNQIYKAATGESKGWSNHCITNLWRDHLEYLMAFAWACYYELLNRGKKPPLPYGFHDDIASAISCGLDDRVPVPHFTKLKWWTDAMKSHLLAKCVSHYGPIWPEHIIQSGYFAINKDSDWQLYSAHKGDERNEN